MSPTEQEKMASEKMLARLHRIGEQDAALARAYPKFKEACMADLDPDKAEALISWHESPTKGNCLLLGPVGTGKTYAAFSIVRKHWATGATWAFWPVTDLLEALRPGTSRDEEAFTSACNVDLLVLDDLGSERASDWTTEKIYMIVNSRWMNDRPMVVTSNLNKAGLEKTLEPRTVSRLLDSSLIVYFMGEDRRKR